MYGKTQQKTLLSLYMSYPIIAPSILSADFWDIKSAVADIEASTCSWIHLDIMDGRFVPPITFGSKMVGDIRQHTKLFLDVHLMIEEPERHVQEFIQSGADAVTFHQEACIHSHRLLQRIKELGKKPGISIVPSTPVSAIFHLLPFLDQVLVMTVNPGYGGQDLLPFCLEKVKELNDIRSARKLNFKIAIDGGVNTYTLSQIAMSKPDVLVMGSAFFSARDKISLIANMRSQWQKTIENEGSIH